MQIKIKPLLLTLAIASMTPLANAESQSAREIMEEMDRVQRTSQSSMVSKSHLSSCKYAIKDKKLACTEKPRVKVMESVNYQYGKDNKDSKGISIVLEPASERGIGMLTYAYDDINKDTESWLYLSALGKVKRLASGNEEDREPVAFFGSEFTTEDMETGKTDEYEYKIIQEGKYKGADVWVIEATPKAARLRKTKYSKLLFWLDKSNYIARKVEAFNKRGERYKRIFSKNIQKIDGVWIARDVTVMNLITQRLSRLKTLDLAMNITINDEFLTQRTLTDKAFREKELRKYRQFIQ